MFKPSIVFSFLLLSSVAVNARLRYFDNGHIHIGGADFTITPAILLTVLLLPYVFVKAIQGKLQPASISTVLLLVLVALPQVTSLISAQDYQYTLLEVMRSMSVVVMILLFLDGLKSDPTKWLYSAFTVIVLVQVLAIVAQFLNFTDVMIKGGQFLNESVTRYVGMQSHPNILAGLGNIIAPFMLAALYFEKGRNRKYFIVLYLLACVIVLSTISRAGIATLGLTSAYVLFMIKEDRKVGKKLVFAFIGLFVALTFVAIFGEEVLRRVSDTASSGMSPRKNLNLAAFNAFMNSPIIGNGGNNFIFFSQFFDETRITEFWNMPAHNIYLLIASETGVIGLVCFFYLLWRCFKNSRQAAMNGSVVVRKLTIGAEGALFGILIGSFFGYYVRQDVAQPQLALVIAILIFDYRRNARAY